MYAVRDGHRWHTRHAPALGARPSWLKRALGIILLVAAVGIAAWAFEAAGASRMALAHMRQQTSDAAAQARPVLQLPRYPSGCEPASVACVLQALGVNASVDDVVAALDLDPSFTDYVNRYAGDPAGVGTGYPPVMAAAAQRLLDRAHAGLKAVDLTGTPFADLAVCVENGWPVVVWTTIDLAPPLWGDAVVAGQRYVRNSHTVVLLGVDDTTVRVMDPLAGMVERDRATFAPVYEERGAQALAIAP